LYTKTSKVLNIMNILGRLKRKSIILTERDEWIMFALVKLLLEFDSVAVTYCMGLKECC